MVHKPYKKEFITTYALGIFPTIELLSKQPGLAQTILVSDKAKPSVGLAKIEALCAAHNVPTQVVKHSQLLTLSRSENTFAVGVLRKPTAALNKDTNHVVLVNPGDMGNLGTIMRTMLGFGAQDLAIITPAADAWDPKTIRASMGAVFGVRIAHFASYADYVAAFPNHAPLPFVLNGSQKLAETTFVPPSSLIFGQEGSGLPQEFNAIGTTVSIEQSEQVDSLNLALSVGLVLYKDFIS